MTDESDYSISVEMGTEDSFIDDDDSAPAKKGKKSKKKKKKDKKGAKQKKGGIKFKKREPQGDSKIERLAWRVEDRQNNRLEITIGGRKAFVNGCRKIAEEKNPREVYRISFSALKKFRERTRKKVAENKGCWFYTQKMLGFRDETEQLLEILELAVAIVKARNDADDDDYLYYMDFNTTYTKVVEKWFVFRSGVATACFWLLLYYLFTPILFCYIVKDDGICPNLSTDPLEAWVGSFYFASVTLSTVGYGDLTVNKENELNVIVGALYMILSNIILVVIVSSLGDAGWGSGEGLFKRCVNALLSFGGENEFLYRKIRRYRRARYFQIFIIFTVINAVGVFANLLLNSGTGDLLGITKGIYWAIQTSTTIGYGDLDTADYSDTLGQRIFLIFYLLFSTTFVANALGLLGSLTEELDETRKKYAWGRRNVSKALISEIQDNDDDNVDEYEFVLASLVQLGKASKDDITEIMNKFRTLSGGKDTISASKTLKKFQANEKEIALAVKAKFSRE